MRIDINLASRPYEDSSSVWVRWGGAMAILGLITMVLLYSVVAGWITARKDRILIAERQQQIAERDQEKARAEAILNLPENRTTRDRSQFLNDLFRRKAFSWTKVFEDLEKVMPARLHVVSIQPAMADNELEIKLVVAGESRERALELVRKMESSQHFHQTQIEQESSQAGQTAGDNVQFDITAVYIPELPGAETRSTP